ncbi:MAG: hypothetical protein ACI8QZ_002512 [Chlamydiales bacterium]|jgi:hypothetical protein
MARLIVDEGGQARRFRLTDGRLSIGSGEAASLTLAASGLEELHAYLTFRAGEATLEIVAGGADAEVLRLEPGVPIDLGGATLTLEQDEPAAEARPVAVKRPSRSARGARSGAGRSAPSGERVARTPRRAAKSGPPWVVLIVLGVLGAGGWKAFTSYADYAGERGFDLATSHRRVVSRLDERDYAGALREYEKIDAQIDMDPEWRATFDDLRAKAEGLKVTAGSGARDNKWTKDYLEPQLRRFEREYLKGQPGAPRVRVFLKRIRYFKENCPEHPDMDWVDRMQARYSRIVDLDDAPTFEDVAFEVESLTWAKPRDYKQAFEVLNSFLDGATDEDRARALVAYDELAAARQTHFEDRLAQAKYDWDKNRHSEAIMWLALLIRYSGDDQMANDAANRLVVMGEIDAYLRGYAQQQPEMWSELVKNSIIAKKATELGL